MNKRRKFLLPLVKTTSLLLLCSAAPGFAVDVSRIPVNPVQQRMQYLSRNDRFTVLKNLTYVPGSRNPAHRLDLYLPAAGMRNSKFPLILWVHGGGWRQGSKDKLGPFVPLLRAGFAVASVNY